MRRRLLTRPGRADTDDTDNPDDLPQNLAHGGLELRPPPSGLGSRGLPRPITAGRGVRVVDITAAGHDALSMLSRRALHTRTLGFVLTVVTLAAGLPMAVEHHADHPDEALHLEHSHGGHGGLLDQADARLPGPHGPPLLARSTLELPDVRRPVTGSPLSDDRLIPRGRAPPSDLPRAPPLFS